MEKQIIKTLPDLIKRITLAFFFYFVVGIFLKWYATKLISYVWYLTGIGVFFIFLWRKFYAKNKK